MLRIAPTMTVLIAFFLVTLCFHSASANEDLISESTVSDPSQDHSADLQAAHDSLENAYKVIQAVNTAQARAAEDVEAKNNTVNEAHIEVQAAQAGYNDAQEAAAEAAQAAAQAAQAAQAGYDNAQKAAAEAQQAARAARAAQAGYDNAQKAAAEAQQAAKAAQQAAKAAQAAQAGYDNAQEAAQDAAAEAQEALQAAQTAYNDAQAAAEDARENRAEAQNKYDVANYQYQQAQPLVPLASDMERQMNKWKQNWEQSQSFRSQAEASLAIANTNYQTRDNHRTEAEKHDEKAKEYHSKSKAAEVQADTYLNDANGDRSGAQSTQSQLELLLKSLQNNFNIGQTSDDQNQELNEEAGVSTLPAVWSNGSRRTTMSTAVILLLLVVLATIALRTFLRTKMLATKQRVEHINRLRQEPRQGPTTDSEMPLNECV